MSASPNGGVHGGATDEKQGPVAPHEPRTTGPIIALVGVCVAVVTAALHLATERPSVAWVVPVTWLWGTAVVTGVRGGWSLPRTLAVAAALRLALVGTPPWLSDDLYRYLWEGLALGRGYQPLYDAPATIEGLAPGLRAQVTHAHLPSVYPPLAMLWFRLLSLLGGTAAAAQLATSLVDLVIVAALHRRHPATALVYAMLPIAVLESGAGAHIDVVAVAFAAAAVAVGPARSAGALLLWAGGLTKLFPFVALPTALLRLGPRRGLAVLAAGATLTAWLLWPHLRAEVPPGLVAYGTQWSFNGFAWTLLHPVLGTSTRATLLAVGASVGLWSLARRRDPLHVWHDLATAFVFLSPTLHPWYVLWAVVPDLFLGRRAWAAASVWLSGSYLVLATFDPATGAWAEAPWLWWVTWWPALVALGVSYPRSDARPTAA